MALLKWHSRLQSQDVVYLIYASKEILTSLEILSVLTSLEILSGSGCPNKGIKCKTMSTLADACVATISARSSTEREQSDGRGNPQRAGGSPRPIARVAKLA